MFKHKHNMAIKTITVTEDAYESIKRLKNTDESFSQFFLRISREKMTVKDLAGAIKLSDNEYAALKKHTKELRKKASTDMKERLKKCMF
ncbi:hypothetical protein GF358_01040 [Candidatus Woesearchaeota archaeon]|nr:hypothetical protein [Candidatus Woesearchaeota archaeon]